MIKASTGIKNFSSKLAKYLYNLNHTTHSVPPVLLVQVPDVLYSSTTYYLTFFYTQSKKKNITTTSKVINKE